MSGGKKGEKIEAEKIIRLKRKFEKRVQDFFHDLIKNA
jgi:hypothetical protein